MPKKNLNGHLKTSFSSLVKMMVDDRIQIKKIMIGSFRSKYKKDLFNSKFSFHLPHKFFLLNKETVIL